MGWLDWAVDDPAPIENAGYWASGAWIIPKEIQPDQRTGWTFHFAEGFWSPPGYKPSDTMRARGNSWAYTVMRDGVVFRHRPRPTFVDWAQGGPAQNMLLGAMESEGRGADGWTDIQRHRHLRAASETWDWFGWDRALLGRLVEPKGDQDATRQTIMFHGRGSAWEHNWLDWTACPDGGDDWPWFLPRLKANVEEDDMPTLDEIRQVMREEAERAIKTTAFPAKQGGKAVTAPHPFPDWMGALRAVRQAADAIQKTVKRIHQNTRGGELPGIWVQEEGGKAIYYVEYVGGALVRHHAVNPRSYSGLGGDWGGPVKWPKGSLAKYTIKGPPLPDLKAQS